MISFVFTGYHAQVEYFRRFRKLQALSLKGNPLSLADNYRAYVTAYIPSLVYADFRIIMKEEVNLFSGQEIKIWGVARYFSVKTLRFYLP